MAAFKLSRASLALVREINRHREQCREATAYILVQMAVEHRDVAVSGNPLWVFFKSFPINVINDSNCAIATTRAQNHFDILVI
jgi:hypothetical protein